MRTHKKFSYAQRYTIERPVVGTFGNTIYSRLSPSVRAICAGLGAWLWLNVFLSVTAVATSGSGIYPLPLALYVWCLFHAAYEAGQTTKARRNGVA